MDRLGAVRIGWVTYFNRIGTVRSGLVGHGMVWIGWVTYFDWRGMDRSGKDRLGAVWRGVEGTGLAQ